MPEDLLNAVQLDVEEARTGEILVAIDLFTNESLNVEYMIFPYRYLPCSLRKIEHCSVHKSCQFYRCIYSFLLVDRLLNT